MKWDVKHDRAKKVIDRFLDNAGYWQESEDLVAGLTDEEKELVNAEVELMIASIRKRYKLQERLPEQAAEAEKPAEKPACGQVYPGKFHARFIWAGMEPSREQKINSEERIQNSDFHTI